MIRQSIKHISSKAKVMIIGGGASGVSIASHLRTKYDVSIIDGNEYTYQGAGNTLLTVGEINPNYLRMPISSFIRKDVNFINSYVDQVLPESNKIVLADGTTLEYDALVVSSGIDPDFNGIEGLKDALEDKDSFVGSAYSLKYAVKFRDLYCNQFRPEQWNEMLQGWAWRNQGKIPKKRGDLVFTQPPQPFKCGGAPQKVMHMVTEEFIRNGGLKKQEADIHMYYASPRIFGVPHQADQLEKIATERKVSLNANHNLVKVDKNHNMAQFKNMTTGAIKEQHYNLLHVVPPHKPPKFIELSNLGDESKMLEVNTDTLQHKRYPNVFGCGDSSNLPTSKTASSVFSQFPVVVDNLTAQLEQKPLTEVQDGQTACPIPVQKGKLLLAEFKQENVLDEFALTQQLGNPNMLQQRVKKQMFPMVQWQLVPRGMWFGKKTVFDSKNLSL